MEKEKEFYDKLLLIVIAFFVVFIISLLTGISIGKDSKEIEIKQRAKTINKDCYTTQDLEFIIFNEKQL